MIIRESTSRDDHLWQAARPPGAGAAFAVTRHSGLARVAPLTPAAACWLGDYAGVDASWDAEALIVELRYFPDLAEAAIACGLTFERAPLRDLEQLQVSRRWPPSIPNPD
jgi:hypothetical protein